MVLQNTSIWNTLRLRFLDMTWESPGTVTVTTVVNKVQGITLESMFKVYPFIYRQYLKRDTKPEGIKGKERFGDESTMVGSPFRSAM